MARTETTGGQDGEGVILIHGMGLRGQGASMRVLASRLRRDGFSTACLDYPAYRLTMEEALAALRPRVEAAAAGFSTCHIVGHSLGGVLALRLRDAIPAARRGRLIQLGSPNLGSPLATLAGRVAPVRRTFGPVLGELGVERTAEEARRRKPCEVGAVAGVTSWGAAGRLPSRFAPDLAAGFAEESDGKVAVGSALALADEAAILPVGHAFLPTSRRVAACVTSYLSTGRFPDSYRA